MDSVASAVLELDGGDVADVVDVLCESFFDYPVMRFVVGRKEGDYSRRQRALVDFFVRARALRGEPIFGVCDEEGLVGSALVSCPLGPPGPPALAELRDEMWDVLGASSRRRYEAFSAACAQFQVPVPHIHLNMVGVLGRAQGKGIGRRLIEYVHRLSREDPNSEGVTLTTEHEGNVALYEHLGYRIVGRAPIAPGFSTWSFFRPD